MHSIKTRLLLLLGGSIIMLFGLMAGFQSHFLRNVIETDTETVIRMLVQEKTKELNTHFRSTTRAVDTMETYIKARVDLQKLKTDENYRDAFMQELSVHFSDAGKVAGNVVALYFRPDPKVYGPTEGIFMTDNGNGDYINVQPTDILRYDKEDREHVGWYYEPVERGSSIWMEPYANRNINIYMISYVTPVYVQGEFLGVIGMDINMAAIHSVVDSVNYADGFGFLLGEQGNLIYHRDFPEGLSGTEFRKKAKAVSRLLTKARASKNEINVCEWQGEKQWLCSGVLENGMLFAVAMPEDEIRHPIREMRYQMLVAFLIVFLMVILVSWRITVKIVHPIRELTRVSASIAKGELYVTTDYHSEDELGDLAQSIRSMAKELQEYFAYIHAQVYVDVMTGVGNKAAYMELIRKLDRKISENMAEFMVVVFDVNGLKHMNDNLGHAYGDMLITDSAEVLKKVFGAENTYRIGGDEFIVVMENADAKDIPHYFEKFDTVLAKFNAENSRYEQKLAISKGAAVYSEKDKEYKEVFRRADEMMYKDKEEFYKGKEDRRRH